MIDILDGFYAGLATPDEDGGGGKTNKRKYGASIDVLLGDTSNDGGLRLPLEDANLDFTGVKYVASQALVEKFKNTGVFSANFPDLEKLHAASAMENCFENSMLESFTAPKLSQITAASCLAGAFKRTHLKTLSFPALTDVGGRNDQFTNMLQGVTGCTVHFPSALESTMSGWTDVQNGFGGTNTVVLFDL